MTYSVRNSVSISISDPGHLPLAGAHVRGRDINTRSWEETEREVRDFIITWQLHKSGTEVLRYEHTHKHTPLVNRYTSDTHITNKGNAGRNN